MKKLLSFLLALIMVLSLVPVSVLAADAPKPINTISDLIAISSDLSADYELMTDNLDISGYQNWTPIGSSTPFSGTFDGNGKTIKGLSCNVTGTASSTYAGLFGNVSGTIKGLTVTGSGVTCTATTSSIGNVYAGGIVGYLGFTGTVENCVANVPVTATVTGSSYLSLSPNCAYAGGIVGKSDSFYELVECGHETGKVSANASSTSSASSRSYAGGIVGYAALASLKDCYNKAEISAVSSKSTGSYAESYAGGVAGQAKSFSTLYNTGKVTANGTSAIVGAIAGSLSGKSEYCYYITDTASAAFGQYTGSASTTPKATGVAKGTIFREAELGSKKCTGFDFENVWESKGLYNAPMFYKKSEKISGTLSVTGNYEYGSTLTANMTGVTPEAAWNKSISWVKYQWNRGTKNSDGAIEYAAIENANQKTYTITAADVGKYIQLTVRGRYIYGGSLKTEGKIVTKKTPAKPSAPVISGCTDTTITVTPVSGASYGYVKASFGYEIFGTVTWQSSNVITELEPNTKYAIYVKIPGSEYVNESDKSDATEVSTLKEGEDPHAINGTVTISGTPTVGKTLTAVTSGITAGLNGTISFTYQWKKDGVNINGATKSAYLIVADDIGSSITVTVTAVSPFIGTVTSSAVTVTFDKPLGTAVSNVSDGVKITWSGVSGAVSYNVYRRGTLLWSKLNSAAVTGTSFTDTTAVSGKDYKYSVEAVSSNGTGSGYDTTGVSVKYLSAPTALSVKSTISGVELKFGAVDGALNYAIFRKQPNSSKFELIADDVTAQSYTDTAAVMGNEYSYFVIAVNGENSSAASSTVTHTFYYEKSVVSVSVVTAPSKTKYFAGDTLSTDGLVLKVTYEDGSEKTITSGFNCTPLSAAVGTQTITVTYCEKIATFTVEVVAVEVESIFVRTKPTKTGYYVGDTLSTSGLTLTAVYNNNSSETITSGFTCTPSVLSTAGSQTVTVTYKGKTDTFSVSVAEVRATSIAVKDSPDKTEYYSGDAFDATGLTLNVTFNNGSTKTVSSGFTASPAKLTSAGTVAVTITYDGLSTVVYVHVSAVSAESIEIASKPSKLRYYEGDTVSTDGLVLTVKYNSGKVEAVNAGFTYSPKTLVGVGTQTVTVEYMGASTSFEVEVLELTLTGLSLNTVPTRTKYYIGETLDPSGLTLKATYINGSEKIITDGFTCTPTAFSKTGDNTITATFGTKSVTFTVNVSNVAAQKVEIITNPAKTNYYVGDTLSTDGLSLKVTNNDGSTETITSGFSYTPKKLMTSGIQTVTVTYFGKSDTFTVTVEKLVVTDLKIKTVPSKTTYFTGDTLDTEGLSLEVKYNSGKTEIVTSGYSCTPTVLSTAGSHNITVTYGGKSASFAVTVKTVAIETLAINTMPQTVSYYEDDTLNTAGLTAVARYNNGATEIITANMLDCTPTLLSTPGTQTITVTYKGKKAYFDVNVLPLNVVSLRINTKPSKLSYFVGDAFSSEGLSLIATYDNGAEKTITSGFTYTPTSFATAGTKAITVTYKGKVCVFTVEVKAVEVIGISVMIPPTKTSYYGGNVLNTEGLTLSLIYNNGEEGATTSGFTCSPTTLNSAGKQIITVTYKGLTTEFEVNVGLITPLLSISNSASGATVKWTAITGAKGYYVYRKNSAGNWKRIATVNSGKTVAYTDTSVKSGTVYTYTVRAFSGSVKSGYISAGIKTKFLSMPSVKISNSAKGIYLKWSKVAGASGYYIYKWNGQKWTRIATVKSSVFTYTDKSVKSGKTYKYRVCAYSGSYLSGYSKTGYSYKFLTTPSLKSIASTKSGITVKYGKISAASGYYIYRKTGSGGWKKIATVKGNSKVSYLDKTAKKGTTYKYTVRAYSGSCSSYYNTKGIACKDKY